MTNAEKIQEILSYASRGFNGDDIIWLVELFTVAVQELEESRTQVSRLKQLMRDVNSYVVDDIEYHTPVTIYTNWKEALNDPE